MYLNSAAAAAALGMKHMSCACDFFYLIEALTQIGASGWSDLWFRV
jgi:hypothetical protein